MDYINKILCGNDLEILPKLPAESVNCVTCSPPYWGLRDYGIKPVIWDGDKDCEHEFDEYNSKLLHENRQNLNGGTLGNPNYRKNLHGFGNAKAGFCHKCGAWRGNFGLEPTIDLYIKHLCDIFDEAKGVLREDGTCWVNLGDSYNKTKSLCLIPQRFAIEMVNRGWVIRNVIIWHKPNGMPESAKDRFTVDYEYVFFFSKSNKTLFWTNEETLECVSRKPKGTKGIEGKDWVWRECPKCLGTGFDQKWKVKDKDWAKIKNLHGECEKQGRRIQVGLRNKIPEKQKEICPRCKGLKKVKYSFWSGHDYCFEQQFDPILTDSIKRELRGNRPNKYSKDKHLPKGVHPNTMSQVREYQGYDHLEKEISNRAGRNKRCVWKIPTKSFKEAHFAVYPETLIEPIIKAGCPEFICKKCGKARVKILEPTEEYKKYLGKGNLEEHHSGQETKTKFKVKANAEYNFKGYSDCGCNAGFEPGIVLDLFMGAGTTALVTLKQRKRFIGIEIKQEYIDMAKKRIAKVQQKIF